MLVEEEDLDVPAPERKSFDSGGFVAVGRSQHRRQASANLDRP